MAWWLVSLPLDAMFMGLIFHKKWYALLKAAYPLGRGRVGKSKEGCTLRIKFLSSHVFNSS